MIDHRGRTVSERTLLGSHALIYFGYTACPDVCPTELGTMAAAIDALPEALGARVRPVFVTVDPERHRSVLFRNPSTTAVRSPIGSSATAT